MKTLTNSLFLGPTILLFGLFFLLPMGMLVVLSFLGTDGFTLQNYVQILVNPRYSKALFNSFGLSLAVTGVTLVIAGVVAFFLARIDFKGKNLYMTLISFPASLPGVVVGFMIIILFGNTGVLPMFTRSIGGKALGSIAYTIWGIFFAYLYFTIPKLVMTIYGSVVEFDLRLEEAARTIGANEQQAIFYVVIPTLAPVFISAAAISFYTSMGAFGTAFTLANQFEILPIVMYTDFTLNFKIGSASAIAILIGVICVVLNMISRALLERE